MAKQNAFEQLKEENEARFASHNSIVKKNVDGRKDFWTFLGDIFELYIPKIFSSLFGTSRNDNS